MTTTTLIMMRTAITLTGATVGRAVVVVGDKFMLPVGNLEAALIQLREAANEIRSCGMKLFAPLVLLATRLQRCWKRFSIRWRGASVRIDCRGAERIPDLLGRRITRLPCRFPSEGLSRLS
jgi:hypothetical protein